MGDGRSRDAGDPSTFPDGEVDLELETAASSEEIAWWRDADIDLLYKEL